MVTKPRAASTVTSRGVYLARGLGLGRGLSVHSHLLKGQLEPEVGADADRALDPYLAPMQLDDLSRDRQAQPGAQYLVARFLVTLVTTEQPLDEVRCDPDPVVPHRDLHVAVAHLAADEDFAAA